MIRRRTLIAVSLPAVAALLAAGFWWSQGRPRGPFNVNGAVEGALELEPITFETRFGDSTSAESGSLVVRENRGAESSNLIRLAFVRFPTTAAQPGTPVLFLAGGPGTSGIDVARRSWFHLFMKLRQQRDVVVLDQRGVGASVPDTSCPNTLSLSVKLGDEVEPYFLDEVAGAARKCLDAFRSRGVDVAAYNDHESAADVNQLREALGYPSWSLFGYSHGTQVSALVMRDYGQGVERAVMAGPVVPDLALKLPSSFEGVVERINELMQADPLLAQAIPDLSEAVASVHERLRGGAVEVKIPTMDVVGDDDGAVLTTIFEVATSVNPHLEVMLGNFHLQLLSTQEMGRNLWIYGFPALYHAMASGDFYRAARLSRNFRRLPMPPAVLIATSCATGFLPERMARAEAEGPSSWIGATSLVFGRRDAFCRELGLEPLNPEYLQPVSTDHPVLLLVGTLDATTPLENLPELRRRFPASRQVVIDGATHQGLVARDTVPSILDFLSGADVQDSVIERGFEFGYPDELESRVHEELKTIFEREGIEGLRRAGAELIGPDGALLERVPLLRANLLNSFGYELIAERRLEEASALLGWAAELRPRLSNAWDSLGEALAEQGDTAAAIEAYEKSIELDLMNSNGYQMLRRLGVERYATPAATE